MQNKIKKYTATLRRKKLKEAIEDARKGIGLSKGFSSITELMEDLNK